MTLSAQERNSVQNNEVTLEDLNKAWIGLPIFQSFTIDLRRLSKNQLMICREYKMQPSEINQMQYWWYEWMTDEIQEISKEEERQRKLQEKEQNAMKSSMNPNSMMRNMQSNMPQMPSMPNINMPKY